MTLYDRIDAVLKSQAPNNDISIVNVSELDGFFHALACSADLIPASVWMDAIWGSEDAVPKWHDMQTAQAFLNDVTQHYNMVMETLNHNDCMPLFLEADTDTGSDLIPDDWCIGFQRGISLIGEDTEKLADHLELIVPIMLFSSDELEARRDDLSEDEVNAFIDMIPGCVLAIQHLMGASLADRMGPDKTYVEPFTHDKANTKRNDPCPCGSGKKYEQCCGAN